MSYSKASPTASSSSTSPFLPPGKTHHTVAGRLGHTHFPLAAGLFAASPPASPRAPWRPSAAAAAAKREPVAAAAVEQPAPAALASTSALVEEAQHEAHYEYTDDSSRGRSRNRSTSSRRGTGRATARGRRAVERDRSRSFIWALELDEDVQAGAKIDQVRAAVREAHAGAAIVAEELELQGEQRGEDVEALQKLAPIMARLPGSYDDAAAAQLERHLRATSDASRYLTPQDAAPGTLAAASVAPETQYTHARLPTLTPASHELWQALHHLRPLTSSYAGNFGIQTIPSTAVPAAAAPHPIDASSDITDCPAFAAPSEAQGSLDLVRGVLGWQHLRLPPSVEGTWYGVIFRSRRRVGSDGSGLYAADRLAHEEAVGAGGLMMYWYGAPDELGSNLATCVWTSRRAAREASSLPLHAKAAAHSRDAYESFQLSRYALVKKEGETGVHIEEWDDGLAHSGLEEQARLA